LGEDLLILRSGSDAFRVVRARDGAPVSPQPAFHPADNPLVTISPGRQAIAILTLAPPTHDGPRWKASSYVAHGETLEFVGDLRDLPSSWKLNLRDDGRTISDELNEWNRSIAGAQVSAQRRVPGPGAEGGVVIASPLGRFAIHTESTTADAGATSTLRRRADGSVVERFQNGPANDPTRFKFSSNDRWLAIWSSKEGIRLLDLAREEVAFTLGLRDAIDIQFAANNSILEVRLSAVALQPNAAYLVPLDGVLMDRFANWLVPSMRELTPQESCTYGFGGKECAAGVITPLRRGAHETTTRE
jgi:hypothetical protein